MSEDHSWWSTHGALVLEACEVPQHDPETSALGLDTNDNQQPVPAIGYVISPSQPPGPASSGQFQLRVDP